MFSLAIVAGAALVALAAPEAGGPEPEAPRQPADTPRITAEAPGRVPTLAEVNAGDYAVIVRLKNTGRQDLVLWPYLEAEVRDATGARVPPSMFIGRFGRQRGGKSVLEETPFIALAPGKVHEFKFTLQGYADHPVARVGWELPSAGQYTFVFHYRYDRDAVKKTYGRGAKDLEGEAQPWNRAVEIDRTVEAKVRVK